ncbi:hypothetical protein [Budvicia diplopodorum]|uniref:hypothetical protein n=1 Tax=Budvicia diplopodorum TaxID=1119056 RepID=UPI001359097B|nr:hypothetical protein [Budvicia diplopodorum]
MGSNITLYDGTDFVRCTLYHHPFYPYLNSFLAQKPEEMIANLPESTRCYALEVDGELTMLVQVATERQKTYTASLLTHYFDYTQDELDLVDAGRWKKPLKMLLRTMGNFFYRLRLDDALYVGNFLLSTNLQPKWSPEQLRLIHQFVVGRFKAQRIIYRSLNDYSHGEQMATLSSMGYRRIFSRQIFVADKLYQTKKKHKSVVGDFHLMANTPLTIRQIRQDVDDYSLRLKQQYDRLYLDKYSAYNPQFTQRYFSQMVGSGAVELFGIFDDRLLVGFSGIFSGRGVMTTPLIGYDFSYPKEAGLYRIISAITLLKVDERKVLNMSSGAGAYKMHRGAKVHLEYSYYFDRRASCLSRYAFRLFAALVNLLGEKFGKERIF